MTNYAFIISDLHLTDSPYDEYKWAVFPWAKEQIKKYNCNDFFILGDIFDKKDRHSSELVNRLVKELDSFPEDLFITVLVGNHDYLKPEHPYIELLQAIKTVNVITEPSIVENEIWLPHTKHPEEEWKDLDLINVDVIYMHQSVIGSIVSNYNEMKSGITPGYFKGTKAKIFSGDIHVPQDIAIPKAQPLTYIGTPYPVAFGDTYKGRGIVLNLDTLDFKGVSMPTIQKLSVTINKSEDLNYMKDHLNLEKDDQIKVTIELEPKDLSMWTEYKEDVKEWCEKQNIILRDIKLKRKETLSRLEKAAGKKLSKNTLHLQSPLQIFQDYCKKENLDKQIIEEGKDLL